MTLSLLQRLGRRWLALRRGAPNAAAQAQTRATTPPAPRATGVDASGDGGEGDAGDDGDADDDFDFFPEPVRLEITDVFDLHTIAPRDVERVVEEYLLEARRAGFRSVRIIHGKGQGVQRRLVQSILARTPFIRDWTDAPPQSGGWGATVAHLTVEQD